MRGPLCPLVADEAPPHSGIDLSTPVEPEASLPDKTPARRTLRSRPGPGYLGGVSRMNSPRRFLLQAASS